MMQALGSIEVVGLVAGIEAADVACKTADISLIGYELTKGGGYVTVKVEGQVGAVNAAIDAAEAAAAKVSRVVSKLVIPRPHPELEQIVFSATTVGCTPPAPDAPAAKRRPSAKTKPGSVPEPEEPAVTEALADEALEDALTEPEPTLVLDEDQEPTVELESTPEPDKKPERKQPSRSAAATASSGPAKTQRQVTPPARDKEQKQVTASATPDPKAITKPGEKPQLAPTPPEPDQPTSPEPGQKPRSTPKASQPRGTDAKKPGERKPAPRTSNRRRKQS
ncbi:BMC domain-containing protein [Arachnia rubra]|uniref:BMC domain-containing protein n=2 Tax=Arachnia rubra TaxID=1547448 RepID=A0ABX7Y5M2_9ACTN|nr:BMC domain-containing protein [Arachnia rubra]